MNDNVNQLTLQTRDAFVRLSAQLLSALDAIQEFKADNPDRADNSALQQIDQALAEAFVQARLHQNMVAALVDLNMRLLRQQESAKDAFAAGWNARLIDILAHLSADECTALRHALEQLDDQNLPF